MPVLNGWIIIFITFGWQDDFSSSRTETMKKNLLIGIGSLKSHKALIPTPDPRVGTPRKNYVLEIKYEYLNEKKTKSERERKKL